MVVTFSFKSRKRAAAPSDTWAHATGEDGEGSEKEPPPLQRPTDIPESAISSDALHAGPRCERGRSTGPHFKPGVIGFCSDQSLVPAVIEVVRRGVTDEQLSGTQSGCMVRNCGTSSEPYFVQYDDMRKFIEWLPRYWRAHQMNSAFCRGVQLGLQHLAAAKPTDDFESSLDHRARRLWSQAFQTDQTRGQHGGRIPDIPPFPFDCVA